MRGASLRVARVLGVALATALTLGATPVAGAAPRALPAEQRWQHDVQQVMGGSGAFLQRRAERGAAPGKRLAVVLDVDNTMLASAYEPGAPVRPVLRFARRAQARGIAVLVNTARPESSRAKTRRQLAAAGYDVNRICLGRPGLSVVGGKQECRRRFRAQGFTPVANVGNRDTDFVRGPAPDGWGRTFDLPDYGDLLG